MGKSRRSDLARGVPWCGKGREEARRLEPRGMVGACLEPRSECGQGCVAWCLAAAVGSPDFILRVKEAIGEL